MERFWNGLEQAFRSIAVLALFLSVPSMLAQGNLRRATFRYYVAIQVNEGYDPGMQNSVLMSSSTVSPAKIPRVNVYLDQSLKERLEAAANAERRSASQMAAILIEEALAAREERQGK